MANHTTCRWSVRRFAACDQPFGVQLAARWFGLNEAQIEERAGRFARGKRKGLLRGWIVWLKVESGGWCRPRQMVLPPGLVFARFCRTYDDFQTSMNAGPPAEFAFGACERVDKMTYFQEPGSLLAAARQMSRPADGGA